ncbi:MAG: arsenate reductase ArsC [Pseudomonadota bacterium]
MGDMINVLVLCTGNSARSMLGEALVNMLGGGRFKGFSAGSTPRGEPHLMTVVLLREKGYDVASLRSKSWDEYAGSDAPDMHVIVTVCDNAANEVCPVWPGHPVQAHWGLPDPAAIEGEGQRAAFDRAFEALKARVEKLVELPLANMDAADRQAAVQRVHDEMGR